VCAVLVLPTKLHVHIGALIEKDYLGLSPRFECYIAYYGELCYF
jgi:hypothetical protein